MNEKLFCLDDTSGIEYSIHFDVRVPRLVGDPCPACGRRRAGWGGEPRRASVCGAEKKWPDVVCCYCLGSIGCAVSDRAADDLRNAGVTGMKLHLLELEDVPIKKPCPWKYWFIETLGRATYLPALPDGETQPECPRCGMWDADDVKVNGAYAERCPLRLLEWDGCDFVRGCYETTWRDMCSERVVDLARERQWTNVRFWMLPGHVCLRHAHPDWRDKLDIHLHRYYSGVDLEDLYAVPAETQRGASPETVGAQASGSGHEETCGEPHPFDDLADDGTACQGQVELAAGFGLCDLLVFPDGDDGPSDEQRELFDAFVAGQEEWLPELRRKLAAILRKASKQGEIALAEPLPARVRDFAAFSRWLGSPDVSIGEQEDEAGEAVELSYPILGTDHVALARVRPGAEFPEPRVTASVQPWDMTETGGKFVRNPDGSESIVFFKNRGVTLDDEGPVGDVQE